MECDCKDCFAFCVEEQKKSFPAHKATQVAEAQASADEARRAQLESPSEAGAGQLLEREQRLQDAKDDEVTAENAGEDIAYCWRGPQGAELAKRFLAGDRDAARFFHVHNVDDDGEGGLRYYEEVCGGDIVEEVRMKRVTLE